jgi:hypothetical protein
VSIAVPDPETGEVGLIWNENLTVEDLDRIEEDISRREEVGEAFERKIRDHFARMQEMGLKEDESWSDYEKKRREEG